MATKIIPFIRRALKPQYLVDLVPDIVHLAKWMCCSNKTFEKYTDHLNEQSASDWKDPDLFGFG